MAPFFLFILTLHLSYFVYLVAYRVAVSQYLSKTLLSIVF